MPKKVLVALPPAMLQEIDFVAQREHRTRSDLIREALRRYVSAFKRTITVPDDDLNSTIDFHE
jgi:metal-responsive CopG/Arc/MetJ family transcriptional regulator